MWKNILSRTKANFVNMLIVILAKLSLTTSLTQFGPKIVILERKMDEWKKWNNLEKSGKMENTNLFEKCSRMEE